MRTVAVMALTLAACAGEEQGAKVESNSPVAAAAEPAAPVPVDNAPAASAGGRAVAAHPCRVQGAEPVPANRLRAIGTEPFWGARIDGRCVTYSNPDDQDGTRIWTRFSGRAEQGVWAGSLGGRRFELRTSPDSRCSDGMSDNVYPIAVTLHLGGEERRGCAEPIATGQRP